MQKIKTVLVVCFVVLSCVAFSQKNNVWLTYGQSKFIYAPGVEFNVFINNYIGVQGGVNANIQDYNSNRIVNRSEDYVLNLHNGNLGLCTYILTNPNYKLGATLGLKLYYGPEFEILHYYEAGGYNIYFDSSELRPEFGMDLGVFYSYKRITGLLKFDTARYMVRFGIGYTFGKP